MLVHITMTVRYDESTVESKDELVMLLERELERHIEDGMLTPTGGEVIETYSTDVE